MREDTPIIVKFVAKGQRLLDAPVWARQLPGREHRWGALQFIFDPDAQTYDWLAVYDDLPPVAGEKFAQRTERLPAPNGQSLFITAEPTSIKTYGREFLNQFGTVISSLEPWASSPRNTLHTLPGLRWYYGAPYSWLDNPSRLRTYDQIKAEQPHLHKSAQFSTVCSDKRMGHTLHRQRYDLTQFFKAALPEMEIFGHGVRTTDDKAEAQESFRYHLVFENHICKHHITEKLTDAFLAGCLPFYIGCPNAADYFPAESFIPLDLHDPAGAVEVMRRAMANNEHEKRLPAILEARRRVLDECNLFAVIARAIAAGPKSTGAQVIESRRRLKTQGPVHLARFLWDDAEHHLRNTLRRI